MAKEERMKEKDRTFPNEQSLKTLYRENTRLNMSIQ